MAERQQTIMEQLQRTGAVQVGRLAQELGVSEVTVRRHLAELERAGLLVRFHGGAVLPQALVPEESYRDKETAFPEEKRRIAAAAAALVPDGAAVALGAGTTVAAVAGALADRRSLTVVTNAVNLAWEFARRGDCRLVVTGGTLRESSYALTGRATEHSLRELFVDVAIVGVNGISPVHGFTTPVPEEALVHGALLGRARRAVVVADHSKWGRVAFAQIAAVGQVHTVITGAAAPADMVDELRQAGTEVISV